MSAYVLIPGAGGKASYWHRVVPLLERAGYEGIAVDLPGDDERKGLRDYARRVPRSPFSGASPATGCARGSI